MPQIFKSLLSKWQRAFIAIPQIVQLCWNDGCDYLIRLYMRASWKSQGLLLASTARLHYESRSQIKSVGKCSVGNFSIVAVGSPKELIPPPLLFIGDNVYIGDQVNIRAMGGIIRIGSNVLIANQVTIVASNHGIQLNEPIIEQAWRRGDVSIEDNVWIGAGVVVLPNAMIRQGAVIAAGAVVRGEVPSNTIYGGIPARKISDRT